MSVTGDLLNAIPAGIAAAVEAAGIELDGEALDVHDTDVRSVGPPALVIAGPTAIRRREPDEPESQLGTRDLSLTFALRLYVPIAGAQAEVAGQRAARRLLGELVDALDAAPTLGGTVNLEAQFVDGDMSFTDADAQVQMVIYECELIALCLVAQVTA